MTEHKIITKTTTKPEKTKSLPLVPLIIALFCIAFASLFLSIYSFQQNKKDSTQFDHANQQVLSQIEQLKQAQGLAEKELTRKMAEFLNNQTNLQNTLSLFKSQVQQQVKTTNPEDDWQLLKARFILELAQINSHWSTNYSVSIELLQQADDLLKTINLPKILEIRQAIAQELTELKGTPTVDMAGLLSQLDAIGNSVVKLHMQPGLKTESVPGQTTAENKPINWQSRLKSNLDGLQKLVIIKRDDDNLREIMSPFYKSIVKESILLNLQEAQWAVINQNPFVFKLALKQAIKKLGAQFKSESAEALIKQLTELEQRQLTANKPNFGQAIPLLNALIETKKSSDRSTQRGANQS